MQGKVLKLTWVVLLVISAFTLGYYLNSKRQNTMPASPFSMGRPAPPFRFNP